jgi:hypothetical protein
VNVKHLRLAGELDAGFAKYQHELLAESFPLLPRVPYLADVEASIRAETNVVVEPVRRPLDSPASSSLLVVASYLSAVNDTGWCAPRRSRCLLRARAIAQDDATSLQIAVLPSPLGTRVMAAHSWLY